MADRSGIDTILARIEDLGGRLATHKQVADLAETVGRMATAKALTELSDLVAKIQADVKQLRELVAELPDALRKEMKKLREDVEEQMGDLEGGESEETSAVMAEVKPLIAELKSWLGWGKALFDEKDMKEVVKNKVKGWLMKKATGGDDNEE